MRDCLRMLFYGILGGLIAYLIWRGLMDVLGIECFH